MLRFVDVRKSYGARHVLRGVDLSIEPGRVTGLIGSNGAGKTTLVSIAAGLRRADSGRVLVGTPGAEVEITSTATAARSIGLAPQELGVYPTLTVRQNLEFLGELAGQSPRLARRRADEVAEALGLTAELGTEAATLSGGQSRRLHTGMALMHRPHVLFLDEPTVGADVAARQAILAVVRDLTDQGTAVVYTTHYLTEIVDLQARVAILHDGVIVLEGPVAEVLAMHANPVVALVTARQSQAPAGWVRDPAVRAQNGEAQNGDRWVPEPDLLAHRDATALVTAALEHLDPGAEVLAIELAPPSLDSAFLAVTGTILDPAHTPEVPDAVLA